MVDCRLRSRTGLLGPLDAQAVPTWPINAGGCPSDVLCTALSLSLAALSRSICSGPHVSDPSPRPLGRADFAPSLVSRRDWLY